MGFGTPSERCSPRMVNDPRTIAAVLGQRTTTMADHYSKTAERRHLAAAAITKLERNQDIFGKNLSKKWKTRPI